MLRSRLRHQGRVRRRVAVSNAQVVTVTDATGEWFPALFVDPSDSGPEDDGPPRSAPQTTIWYPNGWRHPIGGAIRAGDRIERQGGAVYEVIAAPQPLKEGHRVAGNAAPALPIATLYPLAAQLQEQGGALVVSSLACAVWEGTDRRESVGEYEDRDAEAPPEYIGVIRTNRYLMLGTQQKLVITETVHDSTIPRVRMTVRRTGG